MKTNVLALIAIVVLTAPAFAQHHHHHQQQATAQHHHSAAAAVQYPSHYNERTPYHYSQPVQPVIAVPTYYQPYQPWYGSTGYGCNASRSVFYRTNYVANYYPTVPFQQPAPQFQPIFESRPQVVARRPLAPSKPANPQQLAALSRAAAPKQLTAEQYDRETGKLAWPAALLSNDFAPQRSRLEQIFAGRTSLSDQEWKAQTGDLRQLTSRLRDQLTSQVKDLRPADFVAAKKFIDGLSREANS